MAKTTATVTVGADTKPFARAMRGLGKSVSGSITAGVGRVGGMAMSGLGAGLGLGAAFLGLQGLGSIFNKMLAVSPELNSELTKLKVAVGDALFPAAAKLAQVLRDNMPMIQSGLAAFGTALGDAIQFWTEDAFNPEVWKDIGKAIGDSVLDYLNGARAGIEAAFEGPVSAETRQAAIEAGMVDPQFAYGVAAFTTSGPVEGFLRILQGIMGPSTEGASSL